MGGHVWEAATMVMAQVAFAGVNILYKLAINAGTDLRILVAYRFLFATAFLAPLAAFIERVSGGSNGTDSRICNYCGSGRRADHASCSSDLQATSDQWEFCRFGIDEDISYV